MGLLTALQMSLGLSYSGWGTTQILNYLIKNQLLTIDLLVTP
jgi:hypothetical protein